MARRLVLLVLLLALMPSGCLSLERDTAHGYVWSKRGQTVGEALRLYCEQASEQERRKFMYAVLTQSGGSTIIAQCRPDPWDP
jgi:hypothetical protein